MDKEELIKKWLTDELTPKELEAFEAFDDYPFYKDILENASHFKASQFTKVETFETFNQKLKPKKAPPMKGLWTNQFLRIASVIIITIGLYFTFSNNKTTETKSLAHQKITIELPDASQVTLNALSEIEYDKNNWDKKRQVNLKGEAYFKVQKGKSFDVITSDGTVTVVGTQFSVKQRDNYFEVKCFEGVVKVNSKNHNKILTEGNTYRILNDKYSEAITSLQEPQWLHNKSSFDAIPFKEVVKELQRQYDVEVHFENVTMNPSFTGGFSHENLDNALMSITQPLNLTYKIQSSKQVIIYGHKK